MASEMEPEDKEGVLRRRGGAIPPGACVKGIVRGSGASSMLQLFE
jgi:hypothetical protein